MIRGEGLFRQRDSWLGLYKMVDDRGNESLKLMEVD